MTGSTIAWSTRTGHVGAWHLELTWITGAVVSGYCRQFLCLMSFSLDMHRSSTMNFLCITLSPGGSSAGSGSIECLMCSEFPGAEAVLALNEHHFIRAVP